MHSDGFRLPDDFKNEVVDSYSSLYSVDESKRGSNIYDEEANHGVKRGFWHPGRLGMRRSSGSKHVRQRTYRYVDSGDMHESIDAFGREFSGPYDDRTISVYNGKFIPLAVHCTADVLRGSGGATWTRKSIKPIGHSTYKLSEWVLSDPGWRVCMRTLAAFPLMMVRLPFFASYDALVSFGKYDSMPYRDFGRAKKNRNDKDNTFRQSDKRLSAFAPQSTVSDSYQGNAETDVEVTSVPHGNSAHAGDRVERILLPRRICFLDHPPEVEVDEETSEEVLVFQSTDVRQWMRETDENCPEYLFIACRSSHFPGRQGAARLHELARQATRNAGLRCYWTSENCVTNESIVKTSLDIWRMSDVMRGSSRLVVALREPSPQESVESLLGEWASSIWTLPELLLSPGRQFQAYHFSLDVRTAQCGIESRVIPKNQFPARCLTSDEDRYQVRKLLDHYLGNLKLGELELLAVALKCFSRRSMGSTGEQYLPGDYSYALMGLLSQRPNIDPHDSAFLAFARLSLENDTDRLFERFLCLLPAEHDQAWHNTDDAYGSRLWDIEPNVQVAGIGVYKEGQEEPNDEAIYEKEFFLASNPRHLDTGSSVPDTSESCLASDNGDGDGNGDAALAPEASHSELREDDVVILDGCFAAAIHWDRFHRVFHVQGHKLLRLLFHLLLRFNILVLIAGIILVAQTALLKQECESWSEIDSDGAHSEKSDDLRPDCPLYFTFWLGLVVLLYSVGMYLASPKIVRFLCGGKFWDTQPWFFGFEGYLPIEEVETLVFGANKGRLSWGSHASSPLSGQTLRANRWIVPSDPCDDSATARLVGKARDAKPGDIRVFTLVDIYSMNVTLFEARRPPEVLLICGSEGGMQRALGCSFEWTTSTYYKETVLRLETRVLSRMDRVRRIRLGIKRAERPTSMI